MPYKPTYTWPSPAFPFRIYFDSSACRIFIIENIQHNWEWLSAYYTAIRPNDYFFVYCGWYHSEAFAREAEQIFEELKLRRENFFFMFNSPQEMLNFQKNGFIGDVINQNAWLDENLIRPISDHGERKYDAIYVARLSAFKRHYLAAKVPNLALIAGLNHGNPEAIGIPDHIYRNEKVLTPDEVCKKINESRCGLILSEVEGACFSSSEYLLCGIPVVSTKSFGGRDVWYNWKNSIVCDPNPDEIAAAVEEFRKNPRDPVMIREMHIAKAEFYRHKFIEQLARIFQRFGVEEKAEDYFRGKFMHKMRSSYKPDFDKIFTGTYLHHENRPCKTEHLC